MSFPSSPTITIPTWATAASAVYTSPPSSQMATGWVAIAGQNYAQIPPYQYENWIRLSTGTWIQYVSSGFAYMQQYGIPSWNSAITYQSGSLVNSTGTVYASKISSNLNNAVTVGTDWQAPQFAGAIIPNSVPYTSGMTLVASNSMTWPYMVIGSGQTVVVPSSTQLIGITSIQLTGSGALQATGTGIVRVL